MTNRAPHHARETMRPPASRAAVPAGAMLFATLVLAACAAGANPLRLSDCFASDMVLPCNAGVAVMFGQALRKARPGVPLGLVQLAVGGAPAEAFAPAAAALRRGWLDAPAFPAPWCQGRAKANLARALGTPGLAGVWHPYEPGALYDHAVVPLAEYLPAKGALWYQGESNATDGGSPDTALDPDTMRKGLEDVVANWRRAWHRSDLPFVMIMLPRLNRPWMLYREQQIRVAQTLPAVGLVITTDTGAPSNVHPADKAPVAERAAGEALRVAYHDPAAPAFTYAASAGGGAPVLIRFTPGHTVAVKERPTDRVRALGRRRDFQRGNRRAAAGQHGHADGRRPSSAGRSSLQLVSGSPRKPLQRLRPPRRPVPHARRALTTEP